MIHLPHWLPAHLLRPLAWALVHSLWQLALIAGLYHSFCLLTRGASPRLRYAVGWLALLACLATPVLTTVLLATPDRQAVDAGAATGGTVSAVRMEASGGDVKQSMEPGSGDGLRSDVRAALGSILVGIDHVAGSVVLVWLAGVAIALGRLARDWIAARRLSRVGTRPASDAEFHLLRRLHRRIGVTGPVALRRSERLDSPALVGWWRPTILLPAREDDLRGEDLEPVLAHELAHVRRHDYGLNLLQSALGCLFFFHPGFHWLSSRVRVEREACCDDLAARCCAGGVVGYVRGLARLEMSRHRAPVLGAAEGSLLERMQRLVDPSSGPRRRPLPALLLAAACLMSVGLFGGLLDRSTAATAIAGLDPVHLVEGRRVAGSSTLAVETDGYRYLFADRASRDRFLARPDRYKVRNVALCPVSGRRVLPGVFRVVDGQIVLFCCPEISDRPFELRRIRAMLATSAPSTD